MSRYRLLTGSLCLLAGLCFGDVVLTPDVSPEADPVAYPVATNALAVASTALQPSATNDLASAVAAEVGAGTNWMARTGLSGSVAFDNASGRPQAWSGTGALTVSGFTGLMPPAQVYWTLYGFDSVTLPASTYVVGGGAWQTNMVNHFTVWQVGTNVMLNFITATEAD